MRRGPWAFAYGRGIPVLAVLLLEAFPARAAAPDDVLHRALERLQASTRAFSKYACIETVERRYYVPPQPPSAGSCAGAATATETDKLDAIDRLRLEVAVSEDREIYSWPGATRFDSRDVSEIIRQGPIATGSFGTHLLAVFNNPRVEYRFAAEETRGGRRLLEYRFRVPLGASQYQLRVGSSWNAIAYDGSFQVAADSLEIVRFTAEARDLPAATSICRLQAGLDYDPNSGANRGFLLPVQSRLRIEFAGDRRTDNLTTFSNCREYQAESQVVFEGSPAAGQEPAAPPSWASLALPIGLPVRLALEAPVDTDNAAAGDPVSARVITAVRRPGTGAVLIPAGAIAHGRLTRVERHLQPKPYFLVAMSFNRLDWQGVSSPFGAHSETGDKAARELGANLGGPGGGFRFWDSGVFVFPTARPRYVIPAGFETRWTTLAQRLR